MIWSPCGASAAASLIGYIKKSLEVAAMAGRRAFGDFSIKKAANHGLLLCDLDVTLGVHFWKFQSDEMTFPLLGRSSNPSTSCIFS
ncbi:unnamed protein product [Brugia pahangi]|uniref:Secreted protein n=1 Tax=Brugia pahangi TaxID=6280 RepID=A0A0N4TVT4_BRUPA|nr:unnamed protein product [Brugia pahangi]